MKSPIRKLLFDSLVEAVIAKTIAALPFLGIPIIKQVYTYFIKKQFSILYEEMEVHITFSAIDSRVLGELYGYELAVEKIKNAIGDENISEDEIERVRNEYKNSLRNLINMRD